MKRSTFFTGMVGAGIIAGGIYLTTGEEQTTSDARIGTVPHKITVASKVRAIVTPSVASPFGNATFSPAQTEYKGGYDSIADTLNANPNLRQRIQGTSWYRDYLMGKISKDIAEQYLADASTIEQIIGRNPGVLEKIQCESWWQRYSRGDTNPSDMLAGNIPAYSEVQRFATENPTLYEKAQMSPNWTTGVQMGEDYIVVGQREFLTSLNLRLQFFDTHPELEARLNQQGFTRNNLFTDDWSKGEGIYGALNMLQE